MQRKENSKASVVKRPPMADCTKGTTVLREQHFPNGIVELNFAKYYTKFTGKSEFTEKRKNSTPNPITQSEKSFQKVVSRV